MWSIEDVLSELKEELEMEEGKREKCGRGGLPPGFRFHPTDEELITFYLASKVFNPLPHLSSSSAAASSSCFFLSSPARVVQIPELDLNRCEPWDLPEGAKMGEKEWYFYSVRDRKYPTGLRTNRATGSGYWKATGKDRHVYASSSSSFSKSNYSSPSSEALMIGMKKTLVFYQGRAPRGVKTPWVMHEYRLDGHFSSFRLSSSKEEWVICRIFHKHEIGGSGGNENKKVIRSSPNYNNNCIITSCLPPLLETPTTTTTTSSPPLPPPPLQPPPPLPSLLSYFSTLPSSDSMTTTTTTASTLITALQPSSLALFDDFHQYGEDLPSIGTAAMTTMKQEHLHQQTWLDKIISPQHQLHLNHSYYHYGHVLGGLDDDHKFGDLIHPTIYTTDLPDAAEMSSASLAAATAALERFLDQPPPINFSNHNLTMYN